MPNLLHELVTQQGSVRPEAIAVRWKDDEIPYGEFDELTNQLAHTLRAHGCKFGDRVAVLIPPSANALIAAVGVLKAGCVVVPIDIETPASQVADWLHDCRPALILAARLAQSLLDQLGIWDSACIPVGTLEALPLEGEGYVTKFTGLEILEAERQAPTCGATTHAPAWLFCQHGERACGVSDLSSQPVFKALISKPHQPTVVSHADLLSFLQGRARVRLTDFDRVLGLPLQSPLAVSEAFAALAAGAELHVAPREVLSRPRALAAFVRTHEITEWLTNHGSLSEGLLSGDFREGELPALKHLLWTCEPLSRSVLRELQQHLPLTHFARIVNDPGDKFGGRWTPVSAVSEFDTCLSDVPQPDLASASST
jgi:non-ribosomal peptide synthetase component F